MIRLGRYVGPAEPFPPPSVACDDSALARHLRRPWGRAWVAERLGARWDADASGERGAAELSAASIARHALLAGATGTGKTFAELTILLGLLGQGYSAVVIEPKGELCDLALLHAQALGLAPEQVVVLDPREPYGTPGLNPFGCGVAPEQASRDFRAGLEQCYPGFFGPRSRTWLLHACALVSAHRLSIHELARAVVREDYRSALVRLPAPPDSALACSEAAHYFEREVAFWGKALKAEAAQAVANKLSETLQSPFLWHLYCAQRDTVRLESLRRDQRLVLIRVARDALGEEAARLLGSKFVHLLFRTALRQPGPRPVALVLDEVGALERLVGGTLTEILAQGRSLGLHCVAAFQHAEQLSPELLAALLANCAVQAFFRQGYEGARRCAAALGAGAPSRLVRAIAVTERAGADGRMPVAETRHGVRDPEGRPLRLSAEAWATFRRSRGALYDPVPALSRLAAAVGVSRLYVRSADGGAPAALGRYVEGLRPGRDFWIDGPRLELVTRMPRPRLTGVERTGEADAARAWCRVLQELPGQHCVLRLDGVPRGVVRVDDLPRPALGAAERRRFLEACLRANGQDAQEMAETLAWREREVERLAAGLPPAGPRPVRAEARNGKEPRDGADGDTWEPAGAGPGAGGHERDPDDGSLA